MSERGERLEAGDIVMAGGATAAEALTAGNFVKLSVERLGSVAFSMSDLSPNTSLDNDCLGNYDGSRGEDLEF